MNPDQAQQLWYAIGATLLSALGSTIGVIALLIKQLIIDKRRQRNGEGYVTRHEFEKSQKEMNEHITVSVDHVDEKVEEIRDDFKDFRRSQHDRWDRINVVPGTLLLIERRLDSVEERLARREDR